jgi:FtrD-like iron-sulfur protein
MLQLAKPAKPSNSAKAARGVWLLVVVPLMALWLPIVLYVAWQSWRDNRVDVLPQVDLNSGHNFIYDLAKLKPQEAIRFTYPAGPERVRLALQKDSAGTVRAVFASCMACYSFRKQHEFKNHQLTCGRCQHPMRFGDPNEKLTPIKQCVAVPVPFSTDGGLLTVRAGDIEEHLHDLQAATSPKQK